MPQNTPAPVDPRDTAVVETERLSEIGTRLPTPGPSADPSAIGAWALQEIDRKLKERDEAIQQRLNDLKRERATYDPRNQRTDQELSAIAQQFVDDLARDRAEKLLRERSTLRLTGINMTVPYDTDLFAVGWQRVSLPKRDLKRNLALVALFRLPKVDGDVYDCEVRVTHNPANRQKHSYYVVGEWHRQVRNADGTSIRITSPTFVDRRFSGGTLRLVVTDLFGTVTTVSDGSSVTRPNHRFIGVILDHACGPHYVTVVGPVASMARWEESIFEFVQSAKLTP